MRTLRVIGLHEDGESVVCEDPASREQFLLPADERLRAVARGDVKRLGQIEIELESQMRPREIQTRIRAGDSVQQVATNANVPIERVERFAHPVLLERSRTAQLAQQAHPLREDGPDVRTLGEVVSYSFGVRAQDYSQADWDAWRPEDGTWVIGLRWQAGHTNNEAHFSFTPGPHVGTVTAIDEHAEDLLDPNATPRGPRAVTLDIDSTDRDDPARQPSLDHDLGEDVPRAREGDATFESAARDTAASAHAHDTTERSTTPGADTESGEEPERPGTRTGSGKKSHPTVPAWEDVLLGVRSQRGS